MKTNKTPYPKIDKKVHIDLQKWKHSPHLLSAFQLEATSQDWSEQEIKEVSGFLIGKPFEEQWAILEHFTSTIPFSEKGITQGDVRFILSYLGSETHYLYDKPLLTWDGYDWSNYRSLKVKATRCIKHKYALFGKEVKEQDKYLVDSPPGRYFDTREEAEKQLSDNTIVYALWIQE